jgi:hypothetical protein
VELETLLSIEGLEPKANPHASADTMLQADGDSEQQRARWRFDGPEGLYSLRIRYFDEDDAASRLTVMVDGAVVDSWAWDAALGAAQANRETLTSHETRRVALAPGSCIVLAGEAQPDEPLRLDKIDLLPEPGGMCLVAGEIRDLLHSPVPEAGRGC